MDNMKNSFEKIAKRYAEIKVKYLQDARKDAEILLKWAEAERDCATNPGRYCGKMLLKKYGVLSPEDILTGRPGLWLDGYRGHLKGIMETASLLPEGTHTLLHMMYEAADKEAHERLGSNVRDYEKETQRLSDKADEVFHEAHALKENRK